MQVSVGNLFDSMVYHIHMEPKGETGKFQVWFLIYDPHHRMFDVVDADQCIPSSVCMQTPEVAKQISYDTNRRREQAIFQKDAEDLKRAREKEKQKRERGKDSKE